VRVYLVHHADAVGAEIDPQRPLSMRGRAQADALASKAKQAGYAPAAIWHSGKLRSRQTAEPMLVQCNPFAEFKMVRGLGPDDSPEIMRTTIAGETRDVMLVGHMPSLPALLGLLTGAHTAHFPLHGLVVLEGEGLAWKEMTRITD
jgi:phosphohistidine phosphatase